MIFLKVSFIVYNLHLEIVTVLKSASLVVYIRYNLCRLRSFPVLTIVVTLGGRLLVQIPDYSLGKVKGVVTLREICFWEKN